MAKRSGGRKSAGKARPARAKRKVAAKRAAPAKRKVAVAPRRKVKAKVAAATRRKVTPKRAAAPAKRKASAPARRKAAPSAAKVPTRATAVRDLERGCDAVLAAIRGLSPEAADRPIAPGKWSPRQIVLHLAYWDEWLLGVLPAAITRNRPHEPLDEARVNASNAQAVASGAHLSWQDVRDLWATQRALLLGLLAAVPAAPASRWTPAHALGAALMGYADHDRHHAAQIRAARGARRAAKAPAFEPAFAQQVAGASPKELLLFELQRGRVAVMAALQGMGAASASRPVGAGKWSTHEIVLHLAVRDRVRLEEFDALLAGNPPSWDPTDYRGMDAVNEGHLAPLRALAWEDALRLLETTRASLVTALLAAPAEPAERWTAAHPFGATMLELRRHDRHHAEQIKNARIS